MHSGSVIDPSHPNRLERSTLVSGDTLQDRCLPQSDPDSLQMTAAQRRLDQSLLLVTLMVCGFTFSMLRTEPDLWGHVQYGRDALREGLHQTTTYSFTAVGNRWINHENLSEVLFAWCVDHWGIWSLLAGKCVLGLGIAAVMMVRARRRNVSPQVLAISMLLICVNLIGFWHVRPQVLSYALFSLLLTLLSFAFGNWQERWHLPGKWMHRRNAAPAGRGIHPGTPRLQRSRITCLGAAGILFVVWTNTHGAFLAGFAIFFAYLFVRILEVGFSKDDLSSPSRGVWITRIVVVGIVVGLATLINPYGAGLHRWLLD